MTAIEAGLQDLKSRHPEWAPWLGVVQEVASETASPEWNRVVPARTVAQQSKIPLLAGLTLNVDKALIHHLLDRLFRAAHQSGTPKLTTLATTRYRDMDALKLFNASLCQDGERLKEIAANLGADSEAFQAVAALLSLPFLYACNRGWVSSKSVGWMEGYCAVCGAWPAFTEVRGIERSRYFRCARCGGEWQAHCLFCPYCSTTDHNELVSLIPEKAGSNALINACKHCLGYVKTFTILQGAPPDRVFIDDLASAYLDVAAIEQGYRRPEGAGYSLNLTLIENAGAHLVS